MLGALTGATDRARRLAQELATSVAGVREQAARLPRQPKVYFEEWDDPMISGIAWVSELVEVAGGIDVFADRSSSKLAKDRVVTSGAEFLAAPRANDDVRRETDYLLRRESCTAARFRLHPRSATRRAARD